MARPLAIVNAEIWPLERPGARAEAILLHEGRIEEVGEERSVLRRAHAQSARVFDAGGRRLLPGLVDAHTHLIHQGLLSHRVDLRETSSKEAAFAKVRAAARRHRGTGPLLAERWDESKWREHAPPRRDELDAITTRFPLVLRRVDGHFAVANTPAAQFLADRLPGVDLATGHLVEDASLHLNRVWPTPVADGVRALLEAQATALRLGITAVHDFVTASYLRAYQTLHADGRLRLRVAATPYAETLPALADVGLATGWGDGRLWLGGVKAFADGSLGAHTAALREPYSDTTHSGRLGYAPNALADLVRSAASQGLQPHVHAIGDRAIDHVLRAYASVDAPRRRRLRPRIEHFELHHPDQVERARDLGIVLSMQPNFVGEWSAKGGLYEHRLGARRYRRMNEFRRIVKAGARLAFGSDCMPLDPWFGLESVVRAAQASQRLPIETALRAYSTGAAYAFHRERHLGCLRRGAQADLVLLDAARWDRAGGIAATRVRATMVEGRWVSGRVPASR